MIYTARTTVTVTVSPSNHEWAKQNLIGYSQTLDASLALLREEDYRDIRDLYNQTKRISDEVKEQRIALLEYVREKCGQEAAEMCILKARNAIAQKNRRV